jgi:hypothetical protein
MTQALAAKVQNVTRTRKTGKRGAHLDQFTTADLTIFARNDRCAPDSALLSAFGPGMSFVA